MPGRLYATGALALTAILWYPAWLPLTVLLLALAVMSLAVWPSRRPRAQTPPTIRHIPHRSSWRLNVGLGLTLHGPFPFIVLRRRY